MRFVLLLSCLLLVGCAGGVSSFMQRDWNTKSTEQRVPAPHIYIENPPSDLRLQIEYDFLSDYPVIITEDTYSETESRATAPPRAVEPASAGPDGAVSGVVQEVDEALAGALNNLRPVTWAGIALIVGGVVMFVLRRFWPLLPTTFGSYPMLAGVALISIAWFLPQLVLPWWAWVMGGVGFIGIAAPALWANWRARKKAPTPTVEPAED